jgi:hypothetical protein
MKKVFIIAATIIGFTNTIQAQDETDVLRFSLNNYGGTARAMAIGGAQGSIGADFTANLVNPAALGKYSKSEFTFTPSFKITGVTGTANGEARSDDRTKFNFDNLGFVFTNREKKNRNWKNRVFSIGSSRIADFGMNTISVNTTNKSSLANKFVETINKNGGQTALLNGNVSLAEVYAFNSYIVDTTSGKVISGINPSNTIAQQKTTQSNGGITEINMGLAANYQDNFLVGVNVGIPIVNYDNTTVYSEAIGNNSFVKSFDANNTIATSGAGINMRLGAIYMPVNNVRLGLALHTPTYYQLTENSTYALNTSYNNGSTYSQPQNGGEPNLSEYKITTPYKAVLSGSLVIGKYGFVTADYEFSKMTASRISFTGNDAATNNYEAKVNNVIKDLYNTNNTLRLGAEARVKSVSLRGGFAHMNSPFSDKGLDFKGSRTDVSAGVGFRTNSFFMDATLVNSTSTLRDYYYILDAGSYSPSALQATNRNNVVVTLGWKY